jgi:hypothetical protein
MKIFFGKIIDMLLSFTTISKLTTKKNLAKETINETCFSKVFRILYIF